MADFSRKRASRDQSGNSSDSSWLQKVFVPSAVGIAVEPFVFICDTMKTKIQVKRYSPEMLMNQKEVGQAWKAVAKQLHVGVISRSAYFLTKFHVYHKTAFMFHAGVQRVSFWRKYSSLMLAESFAAIISAPFEVIKTRIICGIEQSIIEVVRKERSALFRTINGLNILRLVSLRGAELFVSTETRISLSKNAGFHEKSRETFIISVLAASAAGWVITAPIDYIKTSKSVCLFQSKQSSFGFFFKTALSPNRSAFYVGSLPSFSAILIHNIAFQTFNRFSGTTY